MKFKNTLILFAVFLVLLAAVLLFESKGLKNQEKKEKEAKLVDVAAVDVRKMTLKNESGVLTFQKDEKGGWRITEPLEVQADDMEVDGLAESFANLRIERVVEAEPKDVRTYEIPKREVTLWIKDKDLPVKVLIGMENPIDNTLFAKREDEKRVVLLSSSLKTGLDKKLFDFRAKDVFKFETVDVRAIKVRAGDAAWSASKKDDGWELTAPITALANGSRLDSLLYALSGLKAKEFVSERKSDEDIKNNGLDKPEYEIVLSMPAGNKEAVLSLHKSDDKVYAAGSLSDKIVLVDGTILNDLGKKADEYREKKTAVFNSWEADRISVTKGGLTVSAVKEKVKDEEKWRIESPEKPEADSSKVETFIRRIEGLEAMEFIDAPKGLTEYGLDKSEAEVRVRITEGESKTREITILVGKEDVDKKQVVVKNAGLGYLFRVDSAFLEDFPKEAKDWKAEVAAGPAVKKSGEKK
ncbi:MAG: DUF4340 domain-containing protein [Candidatus Aminicenantes bacterium]|nr:DUF4340 domain-containing protein [Candidatus Aminicenantes bacterium]